MDSDDRSDAALIRRANSGDVGAFEALYRAYSGRVYGLCLRLTFNRAEAEDCTQETFITAWRKLPDFRGDSALMTWLHTIAYHQFISRRRRHVRDVRRLAESVAGNDIPHSADSSLIEDLERAIQRLPERAREAFVLQTIYGYTHEEVARIMGITAGACKSQVHRARQLLASALPRDDDDIPDTTHDSQGLTTA